MFVFSKILLEFAKCSHFRKMFKSSKNVPVFKFCSKFFKMFTFFNYASQFLNIVYVFNFVFEFQNLFTCFDKCSIFFHYFKILFTLSNIAQICITLFIISKGMMENSEKVRISVLHSLLLCAY